MWALSLDYINFAGDTVSIYLPVFRAHAECMWWSDHLWNLLHELNGAQTLISAKCARGT